MITLLPALAVAFAACGIWLVMRIVHRHLRWTKPMFAGLMVAIAAYSTGFGPARPTQCVAGELKLKNGTAFRGELKDIEHLDPKKSNPGPILILPITRISTPLKRTYVPARQADVENKAVDLSPHEGFKLEQKKLPGGGQVIGAVQGLRAKPEPFNPFGRRSVILKFPGGDQTVIQGITLINPDYVKVIALNFSWETAIATSSIPIEQLDPMLRQITRPDDADGRLAIARFYIQSAQYVSAQSELESIEKQFPELSKKVTEARKILQQAQAEELLNEMKLREAAGQHRFVYELSHKFPVENVAATTLREVREVAVRYDKARDNGDLVKAQLGELQGELKTDPRVKEIAPLRAELAERLNYSNLDRLDAYVKLAADPLLKPDEKLALALSGWVVGSANAVTEIDQALRFWQARHLVLDYLRSAADADVERKAILARLEALEGVGPDRIAQVIRLVPPSRDFAGAEPGRVAQVQTPATKSGQAAAYWVSLPQEYHADHLYPAIIALHGDNGTPQQELQGFWAGESERRGYVVIAPEYVPTAARNQVFDFSPESHQIVIDSLRDALLRYNIDANRVFLSGHGMGGDAAWDMGLSHPDLFAGVIPINGAIDRCVPNYLPVNGKQLPFYAVCGEFDRDLADRNLRSLMKMLLSNYDLIYAEYNGAGPDAFYSEIHVLFDWMSRLRRGPPPKQIEASTLRECDTSFFWYLFSGIPENLKNIDWAKINQRVVHPLNVSARITPANTLSITSRAATHRLWLARGDGLVDFNRRLKVEINGKKVWNGFVKPDLKVMLDRVRICGDRQHLYWGVLDF